LLCAARGFGHHLLMHSHEPRNARLVRGHHCFGAIRALHAITDGRRLHRGAVDVLLLNAKLR
jgi:hypothetical protein